MNETQTLPTVTLRSFIDEELPKLIDISSGVILKFLVEHFITAYDLKISFIKSVDLYGKDDDEPPEVIEEHMVNEAGASEVILYIADMYRDKHRPHLNSINVGNEICGIISNYEPAKYLALWGENKG